MINNAKKVILISALTVLLIITAIFISACEKAPEVTDDETATETLTKAVTEITTEAETEPDAPLGAVKIKPVGEVVYPYASCVRAYLEAGEGAKVTDFMKKIDDQHEDITIEWEYEGEDTVSSFDFEYSLNEDFSDSVSVRLSSSTKRRKLMNLYKAAKYYVRVTATGENETVSDTVSFTTTSLGPRVLNVGGYYGNVRDMGGYKTEDGLTVLQDKAFRGSALDNCVDANKSTLTTTGKKFFNEEVKIKTELDFRSTDENCKRTTPALESAENYVQVPIVNFQGAFYKEQASLYKTVFRTFADEKNYPIYFHCAAGADRTGTVAAILLALLGVGREEIIQDFELTSFSKVGERPKEKLMPVLDNLERFNGETLSKKTENYLLSIGLSKREIYNIKAIMLGLDPDGYTDGTAYELKEREFTYLTGKGGDIKLTLFEQADVVSVTVNGAEIPFEQTDKTVILKESGLKNAGRGNLTGIVDFKDGNKIRFSVIIDEADITEDFKVTHRSAGPSAPYYTYVFMSYPNDIFDGIEYHFHSRPAEFPNVEANILINGVSVEELNRQDMSKYTFSEFPGNSVDRHKVPVTILCQGNTVTLLIHTGWLQSYLSGGGMTVTVTKDFEFTNKGIRYYMTSDGSYEV